MSSGLSARRSASVHTPFDASHHSSGLPLASPLAVTAEMAANVSHDASDPPRKSMLPAVGRAYNILHNALAPASTQDLDSAPVRPRLHRRFWSQGPSSLPKSALEQIRASLAMSAAGDPPGSASKSAERAGTADGGEDAESDALLSRRRVEQGLRLASQALDEDRTSDLDRKDFVGMSKCPWLASFVC